VSGGVALAFLAAAALIGWRVRRAAGVLPFAASLTELDRDVKALEPRE
jgi:uncharacterized membrane protein YqjE